MLFNSFQFLGFFAALVAIYYLVFPKARWALLLVASLGFYATFHVAYVLLLVGATLAAYLVGLAIGASKSERQRRTFLILGIILEFAALFVFKYFDFFSSSLDALLGSGVLGAARSRFPLLGLLVPVGLSFYSFSCVSYLVDVYRGRLAPERHPGSLGLYVSFFPKLLAGPIERATTFLPQLQRQVHFEPDGVTQGLQLMLWGLFKKVVIADRLAAFVDQAYAHPAFVSPAQLTLATYFFAFQIYCDFSGYSDIAIGAARVLGFKLMDNFRRPYLSTSVPEFWAHRWHLSLTSWFRDYMYFPMGGSRVPQFRVYLNQFAVFVVSGLWHGANWTFVIWGALNGVYQIITLLTRPPRAKIAAVVRLPHAVSSILSGLVTFHLILISWVFFRASSLSDAWVVLTRIWTSLPILPVLLRPYLSTADVLLSIGLIALLMIVEAIDERRSVWERLRVQPVYVRWAVYYALLFGLVGFGVWGMRQFVYMQF